MDANRLMELNISSNILAAFYAAKTSYCIVNQKEPDAGEKEKLLKDVISMFENLSTSYLKDIEDLAEGAR